MESLYLPLRKILIMGLLAVTAAPLARAQTAEVAGVPNQQEIAEKPSSDGQTSEARVTGDQPGDDEPFADSEFDSTWSSSEINPLNEQAELLDLTPGEVITVENSIEQWVRELLQPFVRSEEYSIYVDVTMKADPFRLRTYREKIDRLSLPGLPAMSDEAGHPRENPLFSMIEKKKIILVFFKPVDPAQSGLITEILKAKRLIVEAKGDSLVLNSAADPSILERAQDLFSFFRFETEEGQPGWLGPMSALVSVTMIFAFLVLIWQIVLLKKGGPSQRQIVLKGARRPIPRAMRRTARPTASPAGPTKLKVALKSAVSTARKGASAAGNGFIRGRRSGKSALRWIRRRFLGQVVPPVWPPKAVFDARNAAESAPKESVVVRSSIQVLPMGGNFSFRGISTMPKAVVGGALRGVDSRTLAVALINEDPDTIELVLGNLPEDRRDELVQQAIALDSSGTRDFGADILRARNRIAENLAVELHRNARLPNV